MDKALLIFLGGGAGSLLRYSFSKLLPWTPGTFPYSTFTANLAASFLAGFMAAWLMKNATYDWPRFLILIGFCGGLSTFSTFSVECFSLFSSGKTVLAIVYMFSSLIATLLLTLMGLYLHKIIFSE